MEAYRHPDEDVPVRSVVVMAAVWPMALSIALGIAVGEMAVRAPSAIEQAERP
jgi:hypothetical protein